MLRIIKAHYGDITFSAKILPQHTRSQTPRVAITLNLKLPILHNFYIRVTLYTFFYIDFSCCTLSTTNACFIQYSDLFSIICISRFSFSVLYSVHASLVLLPVSIRFHSILVWHLALFFSSCFCFTESITRIYITFHFVLYAIMI